MRRTLLFALLVIQAFPLSAAPVSCSSVGTVAGLVALGGSGCLLDSPASGFLQSNYTYSAQSALGNPVPDATSLTSVYFGGQIISGLAVLPLDTLTITFAYTWDTGTDRVSFPSAAINSNNSVAFSPATALTTQVCVGAAFAGVSCTGDLFARTSTGSGISESLLHAFPEVNDFGGVIGFRHTLTLAAEAALLDVNFTNSAQLSPVPEPGTFVTFFGAALILALKRAQSRGVREGVRRQQSLPRLT